MAHFARRAVSIVCRRRFAAAYSWEVAESGCGKPDPEVRELIVGPGFREEVARLPIASLWGRGRGLMIRRTRRGMARLFVLETEGQLAGYGFAQPWKGWAWLEGALGPPGLILGPFVTVPGFRRRGIYGRMLLHLIDVLAEEGAERFYIWARPSNVGSRKGIERAGFVSKGCHEQRTWLLGLFHQHRALPHLPGQINQPKS